MFLELTKAVMGENSVQLDSGKLIALKIAEFEPLVHPTEPGTTVTTHAGNKHIVFESYEQIAIYWSVKSINHPNY